MSIPRNYGNQYIDFSDRAVTSDLMKDCLFQTETVRRVVKPITKGPVRSRDAATSRDTRIRRISVPLARRGKFWAVRLGYLLLLSTYTTIP